MKSLVLFAKLQHLYQDLTEMVLFKHGILA